MKNNLFFKLSIVMSITILMSSCSVFMAAKKSGVSVDQLNQCKTRTCVLSKGAVPTNSKKNKDGAIVEEIYQVKKPTGSTSRAAMHGLLDVATFGIWEVAGTPMEGVMGKEEMYGIKVLYKDNGEDITAIQLVQ